MMIRSLARDRRGATIIEFAIVAPVMLITIMGLGDLLHQVYTQSVLDGALQKAARDSALQGGADNASVIDAKVLAMVRSVAKTATGNVSRETYSTYGAMSPERFTDKNGNNLYDANECFDDINGNKKWDANPARTGQGGANDVTRYTMRITYDRPFPVTKMFGWSGQQSLVSKLSLKNQPYASQQTQTVTTICP